MNRLRRQVPRETICPVGICVQLAHGEADPTVYFQLAGAPVSPLTGTAKAPTR